MCINCIHFLDMHCWFTLLCIYCFAVLSLDAMDVSGEQQIDVDHDLFKERLDKNGNKVEDKPEKQGTCRLMMMKV